MPKYRHKGESARLIGFYSGIWMNGLSDQVMLLLVSGVSGVTATEFCVKMGARPENAREIIAEARKKLTIAASFNRDEQLGKAISRLEDLYSKSVAAKDAAILYYGFDP